MLDKEEGIKIFNIVQEIQEYQKQIAKYKEENKYLQEILDNINASDGETTTPVLDLVNENKELQQRIDKAIEYIEEHYSDFPDGMEENYDEITIKILKGDSNE